MRPERVVLVAGTDTEVGKTWVAAAVAAGLRHAGVTVAARKPVQSFEPGAGPTDAEVLAAATGEDPATVCPPAPLPPSCRWRRRWPPTPWAWTPFTVADLAGELTWPEGVAGGLRRDRRRGALAASPPTATPSSWPGVVEPDLVLLVADAALGAMNAVLSSAPWLSAWPTAVLLNRFDAADDLHQRNLAWLVERHGLDVHTDPASLEALCRP